MISQKKTPYLFVSRNCPALIALFLLALSTTMRADPTLPSFGSSVFNVTISNSKIDGGATMSTNNSAASNASVLQAFISYCSTNTAGGIGGAVEVPAGTYSLNEVLMKKNVNLKIDTNCVLQDANYSNTLLSYSGTVTNVEISGGGIIDGNATTTAAGNKLVYLSGIRNLEITNITVENAGNEHLAVENATNVTISGVTIADPRTLAANNGAYLPNTDGIDFWGTNFLIKNCNVADGDDDICAKPASGPCASIVITNCTIGAGHGISIGGGTAFGLSNMLVTTCTFNGTTNGIRIKACDISGSDSGGGTNFPVTGVTYSNIIMSNVANPIVIESFYNGSDTFPSSPTNRTYYPTNPTAVDSFTPIYENIAFDNIEITNAANAGYIQGLYTTPLSINTLSFSNVTISAARAMEMWYATNVDVSGGLSVTLPTNSAYANATPIPGVWSYNLTGLVVPEPSTYALLALGSLVMVLAWRRKDAKEWL